MHVDRRLDTRYPADFEVWVTNLLKLGHSAAGRMRDISELGVCVVAPLRLAAGDMVRLDVADSALFGLVTYAVPEGADWRSGIEVQQVLMGESALSQLLRQVLERTMPAIAPQLRR
jgi:hypothetical protein